MPILVIPAAALIAALWYWVQHAGNDTPSTQATWVKTSSTALLALYGAMTGAPIWVIVGLALGSIGDLALSRQGDRAFLAGMAAFALGHLAYIIEFVGQGLTGPMTFPVWFTVGVMVILVSFTALWIAPKAGALAWPVRGYALIIALMASSAALLPDVTGRATIQIGVGAFVVSDLILAIRMFVLRESPRKLRLSQALWPLYWGGQALILWGSLT